MKLEDFRRNYQSGTLNRADLAADPVEQFEAWLREMMASDIADPTAMVLATVGADSTPQQRYVLLKHFSAGGFMFFTDTHSRKGLDIAHNANVGLLFPWHAYERQVRVSGVASMLKRQQVETYFHSRPLPSQVAAYTSQQSESIESRAELQRRYQENLQKFEDQAPLPDRWGGYLVMPTRFEFWQGGEHRLHDRFEYIAETQTSDHGDNEKQTWLINRLQP